MSEEQICVVYDESGDAVRDFPYTAQALAEEAEELSDFTTQYVELTRRDGKEIPGPTCSVKHCRERASFCHTTSFGNLVIEIELCRQHQKEAR